MRSMQTRKKQHGLSTKEKRHFVNGHNVGNDHKDKKSTKEENYMIKGARGTSVRKPDKKIKMYVATKQKSEQVQVYE